jgi:hypothetical protein
MFNLRICLRILKNEEGLLKASGPLIVFVMVFDLEV